MLWNFNMYLKTKYISVMYILTILRLKYITSIYILARNVYLHPFRKKVLPQIILFVDYIHFFQYCTFISDDKIVLWFNFRNMSLRKRTVKFGRCLFTKRWVSCPSLMNPFEHSSWLKSVLFQSLLHATKVKQVIYPIIFESID